VDHRLPAGVLVNPLVDRHVERLEQVAVSSGRDKRAVLGAKVGAGHERDGHPFPDDLVDPRQVFQRDLALALENGVDEIAAGCRADIPLLDVADALGILQPWSGHEGDVAEARAAEVRQNRLVGALVQLFGPPLEIGQLALSNRAEFLQVILEAQVLVVQGRLAHDGIEVVAVLRHAAAGRRRPVAFRILQNIAVRLWLGIEPAGDEHRRAVVQGPGLPAFGVVAEKRAG